MASVHLIHEEKDGLICKKSKFKLIFRVFDSFIVLKCLGHHQFIFCQCLKLLIITLPFYNQLQVGIITWRILRKIKSLLLTIVMLYTRSGTFLLDAPLPLKSDTVLHEWGPRFNALTWEIPSMGLLNFLANIWVKEHFSKIVTIVSMDQSHCKTFSNKLSTVMDGWKLQTFNWPNCMSWLLFEKVHHNKY